MESMRRFWLCFVIVLSWSAGVIGQFEYFDTTGANTFHDGVLLPKGLLTVGYQSDTSVWPILHTRFSQIDTENRTIESFVESPYTDADASYRI